MDFLSHDVRRPPPATCEIHGRPQTKAEEIYVHFSKLTMAASSRRAAVAEASISGGADKFCDAHARQPGRQFCALGLRPIKRGAAPGVHGQLFGSATGVRFVNRRQVFVGAGALGAGALGAAGYGAWQFVEMERYVAVAESIRSPLADRPELKELIRLATLAANGHNTQPWRFHVIEGRIEIRPDFARRTPVVDPDDHHLFASLGCAAENLVIAAAARGRQGVLSFAPAGGSLVFEFNEGPPAVSPLFEAITRRQSTRAEFDGRSAPSADLAALADAARIPGVELILITERPRIDDILALVVAGNSAQMADAAFMRELESWLRFNPRQALETGDGLFSAASGNPTAPAWLGGLLFDWAFRAGPENDKYARHLRSSAGVAVFVSAENDRDHWARSGRASQRFALQATALGLKHAFVNQPVEVPAVRRQLAAYLGVGARRPDLVMRFGYGPEMPKSLRRPVEQVLARGDDQASCLGPSIVAGLTILSKSAAST